MFLVQLSDQDLDPVFIGVRDGERRDHTFYVRKGCVDADKFSVEFEVLDGSFSLHIYKLAHLVRLGFELQTLR